MNILMNKAERKQLWLRATGEARVRDREMRKYNRDQKRGLKGPCANKKPHVSSY